MSVSSPGSVNIIIPVYKPHLTHFERIALTQCLRVLGNYPIWLVGPHALDVSAYREIGPALQLKTFDDAYFSDVQGYNRLMLSDEFYRAFTDKEYLLIYQLDAFVFQDDLAYWCSQNYDYVGAPWLRDRDFTGPADQIWFGIKQRIATFFNLKKADGVTPREIINLNGIGCGGFSLRRVSAMLRCLGPFSHKIDQYNKNSAHHYHEDVFWGVEVNRHWPHLRIPSYREAVRFSIEFYPKWAVEHYNDGKLPFGCHAWNIHGTDYWRPIFAQYGYQI